MIMEVERHGWLKARGLSLVERYLVFQRILLPNLKYPSTHLGTSLKIKLGSMIKQQYLETT